MSGLGKQIKYEWSGEADQVRSCGLTVQAHADNCRESYLRRGAAGSSAASISIGKTDELEIRTWPGTRQRLELEVPNQDSGVGRRVLG
ncbi:MAG: hypothetical protein ACXVBB_03340 [Isosphaeraceae bacterium]